MSTWTKGLAIAGCAFVGVCARGADSYWTMTSAGWADTQTNWSWGNFVGWSGGVPATSADTGYVGAHNGSNTIANANTNLGVAGNAPTIVIGPGGTVYQIVSVSNETIRLAGGTWDFNWRTGKSLSSALDVASNSLVVGNGGLATDGNGATVKGVVTGAVGATITIRNTVRWDPTAYASFHSGFLVTTGNLQALTADAQLGDGPIEVAPGGNVCRGYVWQSTTLTLRQTVRGGGFIQYGTGAGTNKSTVMNGNTVAPGNASGTDILTVCGNLTFSNATLSLRLNGTTPGTGHDQLAVANLKTNATVNLNASSLSLSLGFTPAVSDMFTILDNQTPRSTLGTLNGLAENSEFDQGAVRFRINYNAGTGNDVVLTVVAIPEPSGALLLVCGGLAVALRRRVAAAG